MVKRRNFNREFKLEILQQLGSKSVAEIGKENNIHPMLIYKWKKEHEGNPTKSFAGHGNICKLETELENYQRLVGKLCAQNEFLKKASETLKFRLMEERIKRS